VGQRRVNLRSQPFPHRAEQASKQNMKTMLFGVLALLGLVGCSQQSSPTPQQIRQDTAKATSEAVRDAKAVAKGLADGIKGQVHRDQRVDINTASADDLKTLPGVDDMRAQSIIDGRPYGNTGQLVSRHVVSSTEYERIARQIRAQ
jgi:competence protein ComEA